MKFLLQLETFWFETSHIYQQQTETAMEDEKDDEQEDEGPFLSGPGAVHDAYAVFPGSLCGQRQCELHAEPGRRFRSYL